MRVTFLEGLSRCYESVLASQGGLVVLPKPLFLKTSQDVAVG